MTPSGSYILTLPLARPLLTANDQRRAHWTQVRDAKVAVETLVAQAIRKTKLQPIDPPVSVRLVWYAPSAHSRDTDSLAPTMKAVLDALVKKGILRDDNSKVVYESVMGPIVVSRDRPRMEVVIRRVDERGELRDDGPGDLLPEEGRQHERS